MKNAFISIDEFNAKVVSVVDSIGVKELSYKVTKGVGKLFIINFNDGSNLEILYSKLHGHVFKFGDYLISKRVNSLDFSESNKIISYILDSIKD